MRTNKATKNDLRYVAKAYFDHGTWSSKLAKHPGCVRFSGAYPSEHEPCDSLLHAIQRARREVNHGLYGSGSVWVLACTAKEANEMKDPYPDLEIQLSSTGKAFCDIC